MTFIIAAWLILKTQLPWYIFRDVKSVGSEYKPLCSVFVSDDLLDFLVEDIEGPNGSLTLQADLGNRVWVKSSKNNMYCCCFGQWLLIDCWSITLLQVLMFYVCLGLFLGGGSTTFSLRLLTVDRSLAGQKSSIHFPVHVSPPPRVPCITGSDRPCWPCSAFPVSLRMGIQVSQPSVWLIWCAGNPVCKDTRGISFPTVIFFQPKLLIYKNPHAPECPLFQPWVQIRPQSPLALLTKIIHHSRMLFFFLWCAFPRFSSGPVVMSSTSSSSGASHSADVMCCCRCRAAHGEASGVCSISEAAGTFKWYTYSSWWNPKLIVPTLMPN